MSGWRAIAGVIVAAAGAVAALGVATDGFAHVTTEGVRAARIARTPLVPPAVRAAFPDGTLRAALADHARPHAPRAAIVDVIYTRCPTLCGRLGLTFQQLQYAIVRRGLADRVRLLSLSFDPRDDARALTRWSSAMGRDPAVWDVATLQADGRETFLDAFGLVVLDDGRGGFEHNAALHVVAPDGRVVRVLPIDAPVAALEAALAAALGGESDATPNVVLAPDAARGDVQVARPSRATSAPPA